MNSFHLFMPFIGTYHNNDIAIALIPIVHFLFGIHSMVKTWFITGTSTGLGRLLTERLLERGDQVVATLRRPGALDELLVRHGNRLRSEAHTSELQSLMRISYAVFCLKKTK